MSETEEPQSQLKLVLRAESIIQRDAIIAALNAAKIEAHSAPRDMSRKIADDTVDLSLGGVSVMFDGFAIHVDEQYLEQAQKIAAHIVKSALKAKDDPILAKGESMRRFYFCCLFSIPMPILFHGLAAYHLIVGLKNGERPHPFYGTMSLIVFIGTLIFVIYMIPQSNLGDLFRRLADTL